MRARASCVITLVAMMGACGTAPPPDVASPIPSTDDDPAPYLPPPHATGRTGAPVGLVVSGGDEQARQLLVRLVLAMRDGDEAEIARMLAERVGHAGGARTTWPRLTQAHQLAASPGAAQLDPDASFESLIDPTTIRVVSASSHYPSALPAGVSPTDLVVQFAPTAVGRRALGGVAGGVIVVRPGPDAVIVAR